MKLSKVLMSVAVLATLTFFSCKPKDADIKEKIEAAIKADPMLSGAVVDVKDGVATVTGEMKDDACKAACEKSIGAIKGVKSVVNNCTVTPPPPPPASTQANIADPKLQDAVKAIIKDIPGLTIGGFSAKGVAINGTISKANNMKVRQALAAAKILFDAAASKLTIQ